jgi:undecaprenyl-diphosphatase
VTYTHAIVLGLVQGLTEFLPVSSSGHLILVPHFLGWPDQGLAFDAALHLGTLAALLAYFRTELIGLLTGAVSRSVIVVLAVATVPAVIIGLAFGKAIETGLRSPLLIAASTAFWAGVMWIADRRAVPPSTHGEPLEQVGWRRGLAIGCAQALALIPGTSRSGITITTGLLSNLDRATAARFAFLLGIPVTAGAGLLKTLELARTGLPAGGVGPLLIAILVSFVSGWIAVWFLIRYLRQRSLAPFVVYRLLLAALIVAVFVR